MPTRYESNFPVQAQPGLGSYVAAGFKDRAARIKEEKKGMATLIAQLAQVGMIKPGGKTGDPNTLSAYGQNFQIVTKQKDLADIRKQQLIDKERKSTGEIPMTKYEIANAAKDGYLDYLESEEWARQKFVIQDQYENDPTGYAKAIAAAEKDVYDTQYNTLYDMQKQFFPEAFKNNAIPKDPPPIDSAGEYTEVKDQSGYLKDITKQGTSIPKLAGTAALAGALLAPNVAKGAAKGVAGLAKGIPSFLKSAYTGKAPLTAATQMIGKHGGTRALLGAPTMAARAGAAVNPVARGYVGGKILGNVAATMTPQDTLSNIGNALYQNPAARAFAHPLQYMRDQQYRQGR